MAGRRTNLALLVLLAWAFATGALAFALGRGWSRWVVLAHGAGGLAVLLLTPWKSVVARRGLRRRRLGGTASLVLALLVAVAVASGVAHASGAWVGSGSVSAMQVHVGAALASVPFALWHVAARRVRPRPTDLARRAVVRAGLLAVGSLAAHAAIDVAAALAKLPGPRRRSTGSHERGSGDPEGMPVTQWLDDPVPVLDAGAWSLSVRRRGVEIARLRWEDLDAGAVPVRAVLDCTGGWYSEQEWQGVALGDLLAAAGAPAADARSILAESVTGYRRRFPVRDAARVFVVTRVGGRPLSPGHGAPARLVAPGRRGFWWVKWLAALDVDDVAWWWQPPFPLT